MSTLLCERGMTATLRISAENILHISSATRCTHNAAPPQRPSCQLSTPFLSPAIRTKTNTKKALKSHDFSAFSQGAGKSFLHCKKDSACFRFAENARIRVPFRISKRNLRQTTVLGSVPEARTTTSAHHGVGEWLSNCDFQSRDCYAFGRLLRPLILYL